MMTAQSYAICFHINCPCNDHKLKKLTVSSSSLNIVLKILLETTGQYTSGQLVMDCQPVE